MKKITVALVGNPNSGKTTIFNELTGLKEHTANYSGVTVAEKKAVIKKDDLEITFIDLPGTYSLTARSLDERVTRNFIIEQKPDLILDIIDYSNLERNLYLTTQLIELGVPTVLVFNKSDIAQKNGTRFNLNRLAIKLGIPIIQTTGCEGCGIRDIFQAINDHVNEKTEYNLPRINYSKDIEKELVRLNQLLTESGNISEDVPQRWLSLKLLEEDSDILKTVQDRRIHEHLKKRLQHLESIFGEPADVYIADRRYGFIAGILKKTVISTPETRLFSSDKVDLILTNRLFGLPIFLLIMYLIFHLTFTLGSPPMEWLEMLFGKLSQVISGFWAPGSENLVKSLLIDGIIGGVGGVIIFLPNIMLLFLGISLLEDSGYMPRAAFIMDRLMQKIGLQGKSFIPMLLGFGCTVPAIMATRTIDSNRERLTTIFILPLMSCGARLPIYAMIIPAFFSYKYQSTMLFTMYIIGIGIAILIARFLRFKVLKGPALPLIMELPPYRVPTWKSVLMHMWDKSWLYLRKAGTVILAFSIIMWTLTTFPQKQDITSTTPETIQSEKLSYSIAGRIGGAIEPLIEPAGFDWRIGTAMIGAFSAKELFVAQMGIVFSVGDEAEGTAMRDKLKRAYTPLTGFTIMLFMLIGLPCMATIAVTKQETRSWKWAVMQLGGLTLLAWAVSTIVFQAGSLFGIGV